MPGGADPDIDAGCRDEHPGRYLDDNARSNPRRQDVWLRLDLARERGVPAYVGFPGRTLIDMVRRRPRSEAEFAAVNGVGAAKLKRFAGPFLAAIEAALSDTTEGGRSAEGAP